MMVRSTYSFKKTARKGVRVIFPALIALVAFAGFGDLYVTDLFEQYIMPVFAGVTITGALTMVYNFVTYNYLDQREDEV